MGTGGSKQRQDTDTFDFQGSELLTNEFVVAALANLPLRATLTEKELQQVVLLFEVKVFAAGDEILKVGDDAKTFYVLAKGTVSVSVHDDEQNEVILCTKTAPESFGEVALLHGVTRTADVKATEACVVLELQTKSYRKYRKLKFMRAVTCWLEQSVSKVKADALKKIPFLSALDDASLALMSELFRFSEKKAGEVVCAEGEAGDSFYLLAQVTDSLYPSPLSLYPSIPPVYLLAQARVAPPPSARTKLDSAAPPHCCTAALLPPGAGQGGGHALGRRGRAGAAARALGRPVLRGDVPGGDAPAALGHRHRHRDLSALLPAGTAA
jgi:CRP-like cAMP-binding protein